MAFPGDINALVSVNSSDSLATAGHAARHNEVKTALEGVRNVLGGTAVTSGAVAPVLAAGAAGTPSLSFTGDSNTGLWSPAADTVAASTGGSERLRIDSAGNVGIGTTVPGNRLHIRSGNIQQDGFGSTQQVIIDRYNGTAGTPTTLASGNLISRIASRGYDGAAIRDVSYIDTAVDGTVSSGIVPGRLMFFTTNTSGTTTERMRINNAGLITGSGTSLGAWTAYTPTLGGTGWAIGNGTAEGKHCQVGKTVHFWARITLGSTSTAGAGACTVTVPVAPTDGNRFAIKGSLWDASASQRYAAQCDQSSGSEFAVRYISSAAGLFADVTTSAPFAWTTSDFIQIDGTYSA